MPKKKKGKVVYKPFFDKKFFWLMDSLKNSKKSEEKKIAEEKISTFYAPDVRLLFSIGKSDKRKQVNAEVETILKAKDRRASLIRFFFKEFLNREAG